MPEHLHLLVYPRFANPDIGRALARFKQPLSKYVKQILTDNKSRLLFKLTVQERLGKTCFRFWQEGGGYDRNLCKADAIEASVNYFHVNPVVRGLCQKAMDCKWSSARFYFDGTIDPDLPLIVTPPSDLFDTGGVQTCNY